MVLMVFLSLEVNIRCDRPNLSFPMLLKLFFFHEFLNGFGSKPFPP